MLVVLDLNDNVFVIFDVLVVLDFNDNVHVIFDVLVVLDFNDNVLDVFDVLVVLVFESCPQKSAMIRSGSRYTRFRELSPEVSNDPIRHTLEEELDPRVVSKIDLILHSNTNITEAS